MDARVEHGHDEQIGPSGIPNGKEPSNTKELLVFSAFTGIKPDSRGLDPGIRVDGRVKSPAMTMKREPV